MPKNTDGSAQRQRRRDAWKSVIMASIWLILAAGGLLYLRHVYIPEGIWRGTVLMIALLDLGALIPIWMILKTRLKEIEGGEEDAAAQY